MPMMPMLAGAPKQKIVTETFAGYNHNLKIGNGEFYDTENLSTAMFPMLSARKKRGLLEGIGGHSFSGLRAIIKKDAMYWVETETRNGQSYGVFYANGYRVDGLSSLQTAQETQLVSMGAYVIIWPDCKWFNTLGPQNQNQEYGNMGASWVYIGAVSYAMCHQDGSVYSSVSKSSTAPSDPDNGDVWIDTTENAAKIWSAPTESWSVIETVYTRVSFSTMGQVPSLFKEYDGVRITGLKYDDLNGSKILYAVGGEESTQADYIVLVGILETNTEESATVTIKREVPKMDYICEAQNRLWGCYYGNIEGVGNVNELYCCALGDFRNWEQYLGVSTDSWRASCGSDGPWTGAVNYLGSPTFFKENRIHPISVSAVGAHQVGDLPARGVQKGSSKSLAIVNETLYYKTRSGVVAWQGGMPLDVGAALGEVNYYEATAGVYGQKYYLSMKDAQNAWNLFCYDVKTGLWMREDDLHAESWTAWGDELYAKTGNGIVTINGSEGTRESTVSWFAETGVLYYEFSGKKYVSRYNLRLQMEKNAELKLYLEYDSSGVWEYSGKVRVRNINSFTLPVRPRRCDHLRMRITGVGDVKIFALERVLEGGSDA